MRGRNRFRSVESIAVAMFMLTPMIAAEPATGAAKQRFTLKSSSSDVAPQHSGSYSMRARFAPAESAGELREGKHFTLIGRFAKGGMNCDASTIFSNGFEGS
jgi:hypothetical protein